MKRSIKDVNFKGRKVLLRVDFNVPMDANKNITDDTRMREAMPTIKKLLNDGAAIIIMAHFGRPTKGGFEEDLSLKPVAKHLEEMLQRPVIFSQDLLSEKSVQIAKDMKPGDVMLLENIRFYKGETKGDLDLARELAKLGDCYVNDAFGAAHRNHASTAVLASLFPNDKYFGLLMENEITNLRKMMKDPQRPFTAIIGGSKISSKIHVLENLMHKVDNMVIVGGMRYTFIKAMGGKIGNSIHEDECMDQALDMMHKMDELGVKYYIPVDSVVVDRFANDANTQLVKGNAVPDGWEAVDCGPESVKDFQKIISESKTILWNGPVGVFEMPNFAKGTNALAQACADACAKGAYVAVGGGDSIAAIKQANLVDKMSYISTGGGAMLEFLEGRELPGIAAIEKD